MGDIYHRGGYQPPITPAETAASGPRPLPDQSLPAPTPPLQRYTLHVPSDPTLTGLKITGLAIGSALMAVVLIDLLVLNYLFIRAGQALSSIGH
jgi:hypothetical protein